MVSGFSVVEDFWLQSNNMKSDVKIKRGRRAGKGENIRKIMKCLCSGEKRAGGDMIPPSKSPSALENSASEHSSRTSEIIKKPEFGNIEEAESSLRESGCLNYEVRVLKLSIAKYLPWFIVSFTNLFMEDSMEQREDFLSKSTRSKIVELKKQT